MRGWRIVFGNDLTTLADALGEELFLETSHPFEKRIVVVPNLGFKDFLFERFVSHPKLKIAAGVQVLPLNQAVMEIADRMGQNQKYKRIPSFPELSLAIEEQLSLISQKEDFPSLLGYLGRGDSEKRKLPSLSDELARVFSCYGLHGKSFLSSWLAKEGWQQAVWREVFSLDSPWACPLEFLSKIRQCTEKKNGAFLHPSPPTSAIDSCPTLKSMYCESIAEVVGEGCKNPQIPLFGTLPSSESFSGKVVLFGFSYLSPAHLSFFSSVPATLFYCSASAHFWEDFSSDRERIFLGRSFLKRGGKENVKEELDGYMKQGHPLLRNWGKLGQEMLKSLDPFQLDEKEVYEEIDKKSLLQGLKQSFLTLEEQEGLQADDSIQIHSATSPLREVEILRDVLETLVQQSLLLGKKIPLREILVAMPDVSLYAPYIHMVFSGSPFAYAIEGLPLSSVSDAAQGFLELIQLASENYSVTALFKVMRRTSFMQKRGFSLDELSNLRKWFKQAKISQGLTRWEEGLDRLLYGLSMIPDEEMCLDVWPVDGVPQSEVDLLGRFLEFFSELKEDLSLFDTAKSAGEWFEFFLRLAEKYFFIEWEREPFFQEVKALALSCKSLSRLFPFESICRMLSHLSQVPSGKMGGSGSDKMTFVSLAPGSIRPAKIMGCLGLDEGAFPRNNKRSSLCEMHSDYAPSQGEIDRFLFLEMAIHAQEHLIFTYQRIHPEDGKHQGPSPLIEELDQYVKKTGAPQGLLAIDHPVFAFDPFYFSPNSKVKKWAEADYLAAKACESSGCPAPAFFSSTTKSQMEAQEIVVDIRQLKKLARNPLQFYFNESLKIYLREEEDEEKSEFLISRLHKSILRKKALKTSLQRTLQVSRTQGVLPRGLFQVAAAGELEEEMDELLEELQGFDVLPDDIFSIRLSASCREETKGNRAPLTIPLSDSRVVHIVGVLEEITPKGLLAYASNDLKSLVKIWPLYLIYRSLNPEHRFLLLTKKGGEVEIPLDHPKALLASYLEYFLLAQQKVSPLMPDWAKAILEEGDFAKEMLKETEDPYVNYLKRREGLFEPKETLAFWDEIFKKIFFPLFTGGKDAF